MSDYREFHYFVLPEYEQEEQYLSDMAKKGYLFEKVTLIGLYHFKKAEPKNMIYRLDFNPQDSQNRESYIQMYKDFGWNYIQDLNGFSYFSKEEDGSDDEIFSNNESRIEMMERIQKRKLMPLLVIFLCCVVPQAMRMVVSGYVDDPVSIGFYVFWMIMLVVYIYILTRCSSGFNRLRKKYGIE